jgi:hypothetical protein
MFGIGSTSSLEAQKHLNARRRLAWENPTGMAPLMAFLSMIDNTEITNQPRFDHYEERYKSPRSTTVGANSVGPFVKEDGTAETDGGTGIVVADGGTFRLVVANAEEFRTRDIVWVKGLTVGSGRTARRAIITAINTDTNVLTLRALEAWTGVRNTTGNNSLNIAAIGTATPEGDRANAGGVKFPVDLYNQTQIFRTSIGPWTRNALKMGMKWDKTGVYKKAAREAQVRHSVMMELAFLFGEFKTDMTTTKDGFTMPERKLGGLMWYLDQWDKGNTDNGGLFNYRPGEADLSSVDWRDYDQKRHINLAGGNVTLEEWDELMRRLFLYNSSIGFEKLALCDTIFLHRFNQAAKKNGMVVRSYNEKDTTYGMQITTYETENGIIHFKTTPVFNENPMFQSSAMIVDLGSMAYRPYQDSDTTLLKNRQPNDADYRLDEWMTEAGLEIEFPERSMYIENLGKIIN